MVKMYEKLRKNVKDYLIKLINNRSSANLMIKQMNPKNDMKYFNNRLIFMGNWI